MSYIDCRDHSFVGNFCGLPLYHPLGVYDDEFNADSTNFVIGGGSGEHPAMVIRSLDACVLKYVGFCYDNAGADRPEWLDDLIYEIWETTPDILDYDWYMDSIIKFGTTVNETFKAAWDLKHEPHGTEDKIMIMLGEFVFFAGRKMLSPLVDNHTVLFERSTLFAGLFEAVTVPAKGYPIYGRKMVEVDGKSQWMSARFDEE